MAASNFGVAGVNPTPTDNTTASKLRLIADLETEVRQLTERNRFGRSYWRALSRWWMVNSSLQLTGDRPEGQHEFHELLRGGPIDPFAHGDGILAEWEEYLYAELATRNSRKRNRRTAGEWRQMHRVWTLLCEAVMGVQIWSTCNDNVMAAAPHRGFARPWVATSTAAIMLRAATKAAGGIGEVSPDPNTDERPPAPQRITPTVQRDQSVLIAAPRPGPYTGATAGAAA